MARRVWIAVLTGLLTALPAASVSAGGHKWFHGHGDEDGYETAWVEQTVTAYRAECKTQLVPVVVDKVVSKTIDEPYKYTELVPVTVPQKQTVTTYKCVAKEVPYTYTVHAQIVTPEKRSITTYETVARQVPFTYTVKVPVVTAEKKLVTTYVSIPEEICKEVPVHKLAFVKEVDECSGHHHTRLRHVTTLKTVKSVVVHKVPETKEVIVNICSYRTEERTATKTICEKVPVTKEVTVNVCSYRAEQRTATRTVVEKVAESQEITVNVTKYQPVEKTGVVRRVVCEKVQETVTVAQTSKELVPYTTTIKVPVRVKKECY
jgi:hypothetical protein